MKTLPSLRHYYLLAIGGFVLVFVALVLPIDSVESRSVVSISPVAPPQSEETLSVFAGDCTTPQTVFQVGDIVCVKASGVPLSPFFPRHLDWECPNSTIPQSAAITSDPQMGSLQITATFNVGTTTVDSRGTWHVVVRNPFFFYEEASASFAVSDPANATADIGIASTSTSAGVQAGSQVVFGLQVNNYGPDSSNNVTLTDVVPTNTTFSSFMQTSGPAFTCTNPDSGSGGTTTCSIASLAAGEVATFVATYDVTAGTPTGTVITNTTDVSSVANPPNGATDDQNSLNNSTTASTTVVASGGAGTCTINCPDDITTPANTVDQNNNPGAIVHFTPPSGNADCGSITVDHCNDCFFPVGTTTVTATATSGDSCSFAVTVTQGGAATTVSCPADQSGNADANCAATFNIGTATGTGTNLTIYAIRSDGELAYNCDDFGNCTRTSSDAPFRYGVTTITWYAFSHDVPGPYGPQTCDNTGQNCDEESHRTGSATCTQTITVNDVTAPTIAATDSTASADANCQAAIPDYSSSVSDNCSSSISYSQMPAAGTLVELGPHTVHIEANDNSSNNSGNGNTATKDVTFTVVDTTPPVFTFVPGNITANTGPGATTCDAVVDPGTATATDNCGPVTVTRSPSGNTFPVGTTTITWTAKDGANNTTTATQTVTVSDNTPPVISCPANMVLEPTCPSGAEARFAATATDNCGVASIGYSSAPGSVFPIGTTTVTATATDTYGNTASCSFTVTVKTPQQTIQDMINTINGYSNLSGTQKQGLISKLQAALDAINQGKTTVACNKLSDFNNQVTGYINNATLTSAQGNALLSSSNNVRNTIGCTDNPCS